MRAKLVYDEDEREVMVEISSSSSQGRGGRKPYRIHLGDAEYELADFDDEDRPPKFIIDLMLKKPPTAHAPVDWKRFATPYCLDRIKPYQIKAVETAVHQHNGRSLVGMEQGTGKTIVGSCILAYYGTGGRKTLILGPSGKRGDWIRD